MDEFYPNLWEVRHAGELFKTEIAKLSQGVADGEISTDIAINRAAVKVWSAARRYQSEKQAEQVVKPTAAAKAEPKGIKKLLHFLPLKRKGGRNSEIHRNIQQPAAGTAAGGYKAPYEGDHLNNKRLQYGAACKNSYPNGT